VADITDYVAKSFAGRHLNGRRDEQSAAATTAALLSLGNKDVCCKPLALRTFEASAAPTFEAASCCMLQRMADQLRAALTLKFSELLNLHHGRCNVSMAFQNLSLRVG
jgi:hypothetical protein